MKTALMFAIVTQTLAAGVRLPCVISDHMVLARSASVPVWGKADAGEEVTVLFEGRTERTVAGVDGKWMVRLDLAKAGPGPSQMQIRGRNEIVISDVVVGTVWLASGQSNMEMPLQATIAAGAEMAASSNPLLRHFKVDKVMSPKPLDECKGRWTVAGPDTSGSYTAAGYYFARRMQKELGVPVGILNASWGGTYSEFWLSREAIERDESLREGDARQRKFAAEYPEIKARFVEEFGAWLKTSGRADRGCSDPERFAAPSASTDSWSRINLPGKIPPPASTGVVWIRKEIDVSADVLATGQDFKVMLGYVDGFEQAYWNGSKVAETPFEKYPGDHYARYFTIPKHLLRAGRNALAARIFCPATAPAVNMASDNFKAGPIGMVGEWLARVEYELPPLSSGDLKKVPKPPVRRPDPLASGIFNGVLNPVIPYAIDGVLWYQGESDSPRAYQYRTALKLLIEDWRAKWNRGDLPFYICQLPGYGPRSTSPGESLWAEVRESQNAAALATGAAVVVLIDLSESKDIHPRDKKEVGERLAGAALARQYAKDLVWSGPTYESLTVEKETIRIQFRNANGGLTAKPLPAVYDVSTLLGQTARLARNSPQGELEGFQVCGADRNWVWAEARIERNSVLVWSKQVPLPIAVRYAWSDNPTVNLYNRAGLPAAPFRTDDFPASTAKNLFGLN